MHQLIQLMQIFLTSCDDIIASGENTFGGCNELFVKYKNCCVIVIEVMSNSVTVFTRHYLDTTFKASQNIIFIQSSQWKFSVYPV